MLSDYGRRTAMADIYLGVLTGILTTAVLLLGRLFLNNVLIPQWEALIYRGVTIAGDWKFAGETPSGNRFRAVLSLIQKGPALSARLQVFVTNDDTYLGIPEEEFFLKGSIRDS